ncbi:S41 family peptidase [Pedobacter miscanthi]|uniref:S41 family peptidase n=1 Tax=Pedobacter miscanthi TaxID=2259170 RepID=UPI00292FE3EF|nr:S41 family peptidase [Pedobacter miscanthi]
MRYCITLVFLFLLADTSKAQYLYHQLEEKHPISEIRKDIDQLYADLKKHHLKLYQYLKKGDLDFKIDSLKSAINQPLTSAALYQQLLPVLSQIGDGHLKIDFFEPAKVTESDYLKYGKRYSSPFEQLGLKFINGKIFVIENKSEDQNLKPGSEILSINQVLAADVTKKALQNSFSDGYNTTFKYFFLNYGNLDNVWRIFKNKDSLKLVFQNGNKTDSAYLIGKPYNVEAALLAGKQISNVENQFLDYRKIDTNTAYLKVNTFEAKMAQNDVNLFNNELSKTKNLILDLRNNTGGNIFLMCHFLKFFLDRPMHPIEFPQEQIKGMLLPTLDSNRKKQINYVKEFNQNGYANLVPFNNAYKNKLYILINGGTFSAASIFANTLALSQRGILIGEETGGGRNNTNAGTYFNTKLKNTGIVYRIGLVPFNLPQPSDTIGRGVMPNVKINYTLGDYLAKKDLGMDWTLKDIEKNR